ncbi:PD-(D/E)XK nuclease family protein [Ichthyenterobacterium sp. W332]|uniref:PD-(D/E)XK nuclease family protein n=1 Tax=Microcosmobacter mediterraneus TaxID=3075607 RepID=A0ABU2YIE6_9FLAO|nr:PD-(D/E)XK nuclease family protein [Ichthyenterobacterium sp. W332]MDT0557944.1 PD-(D/E)XK nuclease family protein [Ichthyenterobacterium sp. W332]
MKSFIATVLKDLKSKDQNFSELVFILPSKRAGSYLKKELGNITVKTEFAPQIISIEDFVKDISGLDSITSIESLFYFYKAYLSITKKDQVESFDSVASWAQLLIADFNEIDRFLVESKSIFNYLSSIKEMNSWNLDGEQTDAVKNYLDFWKKIEVYYSVFNDQLLKDSKGHQGLIYRQAIDHLESYVASQQQTLHHVFVGFNALNKAEEILINELLKQDLASIYWDIDSEFLDNKYHDAGLFIRQYKSQWNIFKTKTFNWVSNNYIENKNIKISGCSKEIGQVKYVAEILSNLIKEGDNLESTAIILGDESLLLPLLNSLPKAVNKLNITMGLPLKNSPLSFLFDTLFKIHKKGSDSFYYKDINSILQHPALQSIENFSSLTKHIKEKNITYLSLNYLQVNNFKFNTKLIKLLFSKWNDNPSQALDYMLELVNIIKTNLTKTADKNKVELEFLYNFYTIFNELKSILSKHNYINSIKELHNLFKELVSSETVDFEGDPYSGLQIMGMLESRVLDFETVIITSVNEGVLPAGKTNNSFIPFEAKLSNSLPTYKEKDAVYTYHFYRLLQRAKDVYITYNTEPDILKGGEMSRFIRQLEFEGVHSITHNIISTKVNPQDQSLVEIQKDEALLNDLKAVAETGFSPSSLTNYIRNPIDFYNQTLLKINTFDDVEETVASNTFGNIIHKSLEEIYTPFIGTKLTAEALTSQTSSIKKIVTHYFEKEYKKEDYLKGKNLLSFEIAQRYIENFIKQEIEDIKAGNNITIVALEKRLTTQLDYKELPFPVHLKGFVDRIDTYNNSLRIIDYKTGKVEQNQVEVINWEDLNSDYSKYSKSFQVLMYAYIYTQSTLNKMPLEAGIISFKNLKSGFLKFSKKDKPGAYAHKETIISKDILKEFSNQLKALILEIFNPEIPFTEKEL